MVAFRRAIRNTCTRKGETAEGQGEWPSDSETSGVNAITGIKESRGKRGELFSGKLTFTR